MRLYYSLAYKPIEIPMFKMNIDFFCNIAIGLFCFVNHFAIHTIVKSLPNTNKFGLSTIVFRSSYFPTFLYVLITFAGGIAFGLNVPYFAVLRPAIPGKSDIMMIIGQVAIFTVILFAIIIKLKVLGEMIISLLDYLKIIRLNVLRKPTKTLQVLVVAVVALTAMGFSFMIKENVLDIISLVSSVTCPYYIIIAPSRCGFIE